METHNHPAAHPVKRSAASASPMAAQDAAIAGKQSPPAQTAHQPEAERQAAANSRDAMASYSAIRSHETDGQRRNRVEAVIDRMIAIPPSKDDPGGSYTGRPVIEGETPIQDADDL